MPLITLKTFMSFSEQNKILCTSQKRDIPCILKAFVRWYNTYSSVSEWQSIKKHLTEEEKMWMLIMGMLPICIGREMTHLL